MLHSGPLRIVHYTKKKVITVENSRKETSTLSTWRDKYVLINKLMIFCLNLRDFIFGG